jgi:hypothetical protein
MAFAGLAFLYWRSREASRMFSSIRLADAVVSTRVRARALLGQYFSVGGLLVVLFLVALLVAGWAYVHFFTATATAPATDFRSLALTGWGGAAIVVGTYLVGFGSFSLLMETIVDFGFWKAVARGTTVANLDSLRGVRATEEDKALVGEGLADALNVGAF